ncbi:MAG: methyltransferase FkbM [Pseudoduganella sp.]|jgi:FkbM family methyltransferase|nr:methyltransferase FkbM [Pseudoduganella sp.]
MHTREVTVRIGEKHCVMASDDDYLAHIAGEFEPDMVALFRCFARDGGIGLDIGANIGCTAVLFGDLFGQVHAFEPSPTTFAYLQANVRRNAGANVTLHNVGLGAEAGVSTITFAPNNRSGAFVSDREKANGDHLSETIDISTLDAMASALALTALDFVKIDVEGFEGHVLRGGQATLQRFRPVVVLELNHWCLNAFQRTSVPEFLDQLRAFFPLLYAVDRDCYLDLQSPGESYAVMYHHILHMRFPNIVCAFSEQQLERFRARYRHGFGGEEHAGPNKAAPAQAGAAQEALRAGLMRRAIRGVKGLVGRA